MVFCGSFTHVKPSNIRVIRNYDFGTVLYQRVSYDRFLALCISL